MAAYLSRELSKQGFNSESSMLGTYTAAIGYQLNRDQGRVAEKSKNYSENVIVRSVFDPVINIIRADLAYAAAGARYGSQYGRGNVKSISIDKSLINMIEHSSSNIEVSSFFDKIEAYKKVKNYNDFNILIAPDAAIEN